METDQKLVIFLVLLTAISFLVFMLAGENFSRAVSDVIQTMLQ